MCIKDLLSAMLRAYSVIVTGVIVSMYITCSLFKPDVILTTADIGKALLIALISDLSFLTFYSRKELNKKQMLLRTAIHIPVLLTVLLFFSSHWHWVNLKNALETSVFILLILCVYISTLGIIFYKDKKMANRLNDGLKKRYHS